MEKPIKRTLAELSQPNFVDFLLDTYSPKKNSAGEYFSMALDYLTNETSYMGSDTEKEFVEEYGLAPIGFLEMLRIQMAILDDFLLHTITDEREVKILFEILEKRCEINLSTIICSQREPASWSSMILNDEVSANAILKRATKHYTVVIKPLTTA